VNQSLPLVSFIAACYNHEGYVIETLESIIQQETKVPFEIIITDDFSKDNSVDIINQWIKENEHKVRITILFNEQNLGLCKTLNKAVSLASGQWIKPISCDDILEKNYLKTIWEYVQNHATVSLVCTDMSHIDSAGKHIRNSNWEYNCTDINHSVVNDFKHLLNAQFLNAPTLFYKKEVWEKTGGYDESLIFEDWDFLLRAKKSFEFGFIKKSLVRYRMHEKNMHLNFETDTRYVQDSISVLKKHIAEEENKQIIREKVAEEITKLLLINEEEGIKIWEAEYEWMRMGKGGNQPLVSVLMCAYNAEKYIQNALKSVLLQTYPAIEIVVVNDGSADRTEAKIQELIKEHSNIKLINQENKGIASAANRGLGECVGKYIARMDADDICVPNRIEKEVLFLEENSSFAAVSSWLTCFYPDRSLPKTFKFKQKSEDLKAILLFDNPVPHAPALLKADVLKAIKYDTDFQVAEDYNMWFSLLKQGYRVHILQVPLYLYRIHGANITQKKIKHAERVRLKGLKEIGIIPTQEEMVLHEKFAVPSNDTIEKKELFLLHNWFCKILYGNESHLFFPEAELRKQLEQRWMHWYYQNRKYHGISSLLRFFNSPFHRQGRYQLVKDAIKGTLLYV